MIFIFIPLQVFAMWTTLSGFIGSDKDDKTSRPYELQVFDGFVGALLLFVTNLGRTLNYEGISKQHELITLQMQWLLDELDMLEHDIKIGRGTASTENDSVINDYSGTEDRNAIEHAIVQREEERVHQAEKNKRFEKIESTFFTNQQNIQSLLPERIALSYEKLQFTLKLILRPSGFSKDKNQSSLSVGDDGKFDVDDKLYYRIVNYAYSELAVILGRGMGVHLPHPDTAVKETIKRVVKLLYTEDPNSVHDELGTSTRSEDKSMKYIQGIKHRAYVHQSKRLNLDQTFDGNDEGNDEDTHTVTINDV